MRLPHLLLPGGLLLAAPALAQKYDTALGARLGGGHVGLTVQQRVASRVTLEALGRFDRDELSGTVLAERHFGILGPSLNYYFGAGGHYGHRDDLGRFGGLDGMVGLEYRIALLPIAISFDFKPTIEFVGDERSRLPTAFSIRYVLIRRRDNLLDRLRGR